MFNQVARMWGYIAIISIKFFSNISLKLRQNQIRGQKNVKSKDFLLIANCFSIFLL